MKQKKMIMNIKLVIKNVVTACPGRFFLDFIAEALASSIDLYMDVIFLGYLLMLCEVSTDFQGVYVFVGVSMLFILLAKIFLSWYENRYVELANQETKARLEERVYKKAANMDIRCYEDPSFYDCFSRTLSDFYTVNSEIYSAMKELFIAVLSNLAVIMLVFSIDAAALVFCLIPFLFVGICGERVTNLKQELKKVNVPYERKAVYAERTIYQKDYAKEMRMFRIYEPIKRNFNDALDKLSKNMISYGRKIAFVEFFRRVLSDNSMYFGLLIYLTYRIVTSEDIVLSDWLMLLNSVTALTGSLQYIADLYQNLGTKVNYIEEFEEFFAYKPQIPENYEGKSISGCHYAIQWENVSFTYKGKKEPALKCINLRVDAGEKVAIVGMNGAGKSTLVKLLLRLYDPDEGRILLNGRDIREFSIREYRALFGTVLQDSALFSLTLAENILVRSHEEKDRCTLEYALEQSNLKEKIDSLKNGMASVLTKEFDEEGVVLSGGEAQKVMISRVFAGKNEIVVLDEPSSALDPLAEQRMFEAMFQACENKSMIYISHRLANVILADRIYVMKQGQIVEMGSHAELMRKNGVYADMFQKQAENYRKGKEIHHG